MRSVQGDNPRPWLTLDKAKLMGVFDSCPARDEIEEPIEEQLVVELYSK
jgi:ribosomal protein S4